MRFAWLRENSENTATIEQSSISRLVYVVYNIAWWIPLVLAILGTIDYDTAFVAFFVYSLFRDVFNFYMNNFIMPVLADFFPLSSP